MTTVVGFLAEVGDVRRFESPRQIQKLAGLSLRENSSGKHKGQTTISKRDRSKLRAVLFNAAIPLIAKNPEFKSLHEYYTTRANNPLKKKKSVIAISSKLIWVFYAILVKGNVRCYEEGSKRRAVCNLEVITKVKQNGYKGESGTGCIERTSASICCGLSRGRKRVT